MTVRDVLERGEEQAQRAAPPPAATATRKGEGIGVSGTRHPFLDSTRAIAMLAGIPFHVAQIYAVGVTFVITSPDSSQVLFWMGQFSHGFRMHTFFLISGFFSALTLMKNPDVLGSKGRWLRDRSRRLLVPFFATLFTLNVLQMAVITYAADYTIAGQQIGRYTLQQAISEGKVGYVWISHLWFLLSLVTYTAALWLVADVVVQRREQICRFIDAALDRPRLTIVAVLLGTAFFQVGAEAILSVAGKAMPFDPLFGAFPLEKTIVYVPFFAFGVLVFLSPRLFDWFTTFTPLSLLLAAAFTIAYAVIPQEGSFTLKLLQHALYAFSGWWGAHALLALSRRYLNRSSQLVSALVGASFTIYLVHQPLVLVGGFFAAFLDYHPVLEFLVITVVVIAISWLVHELIVSRSERLSFIFNGVKKKK